MNPIEIKNIIEKKFPSSVLEFKEDVRQPFLVIEKSKIRNIAEFLKNDASLKFDFLKSLAGVDLKNKFEIVYHLYSYSKNHEAVLKVRLTKEDPKIDSVSSVWGVANWFERETYDLLGIHFEGHPDLRRIMLPDDWVGHPLRKDYVEPEEYRGISHKRK